MNGTDAICDPPDRGKTKRPPGRAAERSLEAKYVVPAAKLYQIPPSPASTLEEDERNDLLLSVNDGRMRIARIFGPVEGPYEPVLEDGRRLGKFKTLKLARAAISDARPAGESNGDATA